jgi:hypothetical protein
MSEDAELEQRGAVEPCVPGSAQALQPDKTTFISYASADKAAADSIVAALERAGIGCWIAPRDVVPGVFYADAIVQAINCVFRAILTTDSV